MRVAVIRPLAVRRFDLQHLAARRDLQRADALAQRVVTLDRRAVPLQRVAVRNFTHVRDRARYRERRRFAIHKARNAAVRSQRIAVVFLLVALRDDRQRRRRYAQLADRVGALRIVALVRYRPGERVVHVALCDMRDRRRRCRRDRDHVARAQRRRTRRRAFRDRYRVRLVVAVRDRVFVLRMRVAVIRPLAVRRLDLQFLRAGLDFQLADVLAQRVVALGRSAVPGQRVRVVALADFRLAARYFERRSLLLAAVRRYEAGDAARCRQRRAVVFLLAALRDDRQRRRRDLLPTVGVDEGDRCEVRVQVLEIVSGQTHVGLVVRIRIFSHVRTRCGSGLALHQLEVVCRVQRRVSAVDLDAVDRVAGDRMRVAVIRRGVRVAVQRDRDVDRRDRQRAVRCRDVVIIRRVLDRICIGIVVLRGVADVLDARRALARRADVRRRDRDLVARREREDQTVGAFVRGDRCRHRFAVLNRVVADGVLLLRMELAVVRPFAVRRIDPDRQVRVFNDQRSVVDVEGDRVVVAVCCGERRIVEAALRELHRIRAGVRARCINGDAAVQIQIEAVRFFVDRRAVLIIQNAGEDLVAVRSEEAVDLDLIALDRVLIAVVRDGDRRLVLGMTVDVDGHRRLRDGQLACNVRGGLVVIQIAADRRAGRFDLARVFADVYLRTVQRDAGQRVAALETGDRDLRCNHVARGLRVALIVVADDSFGVGVGRVRFALRRAVVGVGLIEDRDGERRLVDGELAVLRDLERDFDARIAVAEVRLGQTHRIFARIGLGDRGRTVVGDLARVEQVVGADRVIALDRVRRTVEGLGRRMTGDRDRHRDLCDRQ